MDWKATVFRQEVRWFVEALEYGCISYYKEYENTHNFSVLVGDYYYNAMSKIIHNRPETGDIIFVCDDEWAKKADLEKIINDMRGMMPVGFFERIKVTVKQN